MIAQPRPVHRIDRTEANTVVMLCGERRPRPTLGDLPLKGAFTTCPECRKLEAVRDGIAAVSGLVDAVRFAVLNPSTPSEVALDLRVALSVAEAGWRDAAEVLR